MALSEPVRRDIAVALVYQAEALHQHLRSALTEYGARLVYETPTAGFTRGALDASGAEVVVVNLDPGVDEELEAIDDLLVDDSRRVIFNDGEVSSRLEGWDQARWARHLAAKIMGIERLDPPRPEGAEAIPERTPRKAAPTAPPRVSVAAEPTPRVAAPAPAVAPAPVPAAAVAKPVAAPAPVADLPPPAGDDLGFDFGVSADEIERAMAADTGEAIKRTRDQLTTKIEPVGPELMSAESAVAHTGPRVADDHAVKEIDLDRGASRMPEAAPQEPSEFGLDSEFASLFDEAAAGAPVKIEREAASDEPSFDLGDLAQFADLNFDEPAPNSSAPAGLDDILLSLSLTNEEEAKPAAAAKPQAPAKPAAAAAPAPAARAPAAPAAAPPAKKADENPFASLMADLTLEPMGEEAPAAPAPAAKPPAAARDLGSFNLAGLSLEPTEEEANERPITGLAKYELDPTTPASAKAPAAASPAPAKPAPPAPARAPAPAPAATAKNDPNPFADLDFSLSPMEDEALAQVSVSRGTTPEAGETEDFLGDFAALFADDAAGMAAGTTALKHVCVLGASIGGPEAVREFLGGVQQSTSVTFVLAQHLGEDFVEGLVQQLAKATRLKVRMVESGDFVHPGEVIVAPAGERLLIDRSGEVRLEALTEPSPYSPSIDQVLFDVADRFGADASAIIFSGMAHDAIEGVKHLKRKGGKVWAQDPTTCVVSSMVDGAKAAGVVEQIAAPKDLARHFNARFPH